MGLSGGSQYLDTNALRLCCKKKKIQIALTYNCADCQNIIESTNPSQDFFV